MIGQIVFAAVLAGLPTDTPAERPAATIRQAIHEALRQQATATEAAGDEAAIRDLVSLYAEVNASTQFSEKSQRQLATLLRNRLRRVQDQLQKKLPNAPPAGPQAGPAQPIGVAEERKPPHEQALLAQIPGIPAGQNAQPAAGAGNNFPPVQPPASAGANQGGGFAAATARNAQELVELIETTIAPQSWQANGGLGTIMYFAPAQVLVVRQTDQIHGQVGAAIQNMRGRQP